ncbi:MAG: SIR2 family protein [Alphaproteobacteria bacterium]|nr:MAG: SIR2 family protein [Alphaproteobacteria bacterium]
MDIEDLENIDDVSPRDEYRAEVDGIIRTVLDDLQVQPILFVGAGFSRRYAGSPDWFGLLTRIAKRIGISDEDFAYLRQKNNGDAPKVGSSLVTPAFEWAWETRDPSIPEQLFRDQTTPKDAFLKHLAALEVNMALKEGDAPAGIQAELEALRQTKPHAVITTNYDDLLERTFDDYVPIVGQQILKANLNFFGEIFKIHGSSSDPLSMVLTDADYTDYGKRRKYLAAKILTYLSEHPIFILGYSFSDPNVIQLMDDVGEAIGADDQLIPNIFYVNWKAEITNYDQVKREHIIAGSAGQYRVRAIETEDFGWIFHALAQERELANINTKLLRALMARTYQIIRSDIPRRKVEVDYNTLEHALESDELPKVLGISSVSSANMSHPYVLSQVGVKLGYAGWHGAGKLIKHILDNDKVDLRATDNRYHCKIKVGKADKSVSHKWSDEAVNLLARVRDGKPYAIEL